MFSLVLEGNPLKCDCSAKWLRSLLDEDDVTFVSTTTSMFSSTGSAAPTTGTNSRSGNGRNLQKKNVTQEDSPVPKQLFELGNNKRDGVTSKRFGRQLRQFRSTEYLSNKRTLALRIPHCQTPLTYRNWALDRVTGKYCC